MGRAGAAVAATICLAIAATGCGGDDTPSSGTAAPGTGPVGSYGAGWSEIGAGIGYLELAADGTGRVLSFGSDLESSEPREDRFTYQVAGDRLTVTSGSEAAWSCDPAAPGTYEWALTGEVLELVPVDEPCAARALGIQAVADWEWYSLGDAPIVEIGPGDEPVVVDTPIGTIEWSVADGAPPPTTDVSPDVTRPVGAGEGFQVWALDSGYLARSGPPRAGSGTFWTSTDGRTWVEAVDAPAGLEVQAAYGDSVYGTVGMEEDVASDDGGRTWQVVADRPGNGPGDLLAVGDAGFVAVETAIFGPCVGVVFVSADGVAWQRALNPWPPPAMGQPVVSGDSIVIPASACGYSADRRWVGAVR